MINTNQLRTQVVMLTTYQLYLLRQNLHCLHNQSSQLYINMMDYVMEIYHHNVQLYLEEEQHLDQEKAKSVIGPEDPEALHIDPPVANLPSKIQTIDTLNQLPHQHVNLLWQSTELHHPVQSFTIQETLITLFIQERLWWGEDHHYQGLLADDPDLPGNNTDRVPPLDFLNEYLAYTFKPRLDQQEQRLDLVLHNQNLNHLSIRMNHLKCKYQITLIFLWQTGASFLLNIEIKIQMMRLMMNLFYKMTLYGKIDKPW